MQDNEFYIQTGSGIQLYLKSWIPDKNPRAVIAVLHGIGDHIGRYEDLALYFTKHQIAVIGIDLPGHGKSTGRRGHISSFSLILNHVQQLMLETRRRFIDVPIILYGHSMGGNIVLNYALRHTSKEIKGVIISSPWIEKTITPNKWNRYLYRMIEKFYPAYTLSFDLDPMELSYDPNIGKLFLKDPVKHDKISISLYRDLVHSAQWIINNSKMMSYPVLIMHGDEDRITSWEASANLAEKIRKNVALKIWEGMRHELHHEKAREAVLKYQLAWILKIIKDPLPD